MKLSCLGFLTLLVSTVMTLGHPWELSLSRSDKSLPFPLGNKVYPVSFLPTTRSLKLPVYFSKGSGTLDCSTHRKEFLGTTKPGFVQPQTNPHVPNNRPIIISPAPFEAIEKNKIFPIDPFFPKGVQQTAPPAIIEKLNKKLSIEDIRQLLNKSQ